jgi:hypothetical protein
MTWREALGAVVARTGHERYRWLCSDDNPDVVQRESYRRSMLDQCGQAPSYPPAIVQAGNALGAAAAFIMDGFRTVDDTEQSRRLAICHACEHYDADAHRCRACGCYADLKARVASSSCPHHKWEAQ